MGAPMERNLLRAGHEVQAWNFVSAPTAPVWRS